MTQEINFSGIKFDLELRPGSLTKGTKGKDSRRKFITKHFVWPRLSKSHPGTDFYEHLASKEPFGEQSTLIKPAGYVLNKQWNGCFQSLFQENKVGCVCPMVIWPESHMGQYRDYDRQYHTPQFNVFQRFYQKKNYSAQK